MSEIIISTNSSLASFPIDCTPDFGTSPMFRKCQGDSHMARHAGKTVWANSAPLGADASQIEPPRSSRARKPGSLSPGKTRRARPAGKSRPPDTKMRPV